MATERGFTRPRLTMKGVEMSNQNQSIKAMYEVATNHEERYSPQSTENTILIAGKRNPHVIRFEFARENRTDMNRLPDRQ